jgi:uncharacterized protein (DUF4213/DUF364 family)
MLLMGGNQMVKVIETNLIIGTDNEMKDFQSRVIEVDNWSDFVKEIQECNTVNRFAVLGNLCGVTMLRSSKVENLIYDDSKLSCDVLNYADIKTRKLCYRITE